ncbi:MAG: SGNH/GDSL hydrolase family protein [Acidimicrobiia bacterium]
MHRVLAAISAIGFVVTSAWFFAGLSASQASGASFSRVALYGDSLAVEAQDFFVFRVAAGAEVRTRTFGGTAICDWFELMREDAATWQPDAVVIEFSGNALTPCMRDGAGNPLTGDDHLRKYRDDTEEALRIFAGARAFIVGAPVARDFDAAVMSRLNRQYKVIAARSDFADFVDAGRAVLDRGRYTAWLPCLPEEPCTGGTALDGTPFNVVRAPDGAHFCPGAPAASNGVTELCAIWSSGAYRFGTAIAEAVLRDFGPTSP